MQEERVTHTACGFESRLVLLSSTYSPYCRHLSSTSEFAQITYPPPLFHLDPVLVATPSTPPPPLPRVRKRDQIVVAVDGLINICDMTTISIPRSRALPPPASAPATNPATSPPGAASIAFCATATAAAASGYVTLEVVIVAEVPAFRAFRGA